jgi:multicomponent Na+:H+ antiporter subunit G
MIGALDVAAAVLMLAGALSCLIGAIGLVRLPDLPARLQAATKPQTLGLSLVLLGAALRVELASAVTLVLVVLFQVITAPVEDGAGRRAGHDAETGGRAGRDGTS